MNSADVLEGRDEAKVVVGVDEIRETGEVTGNRCERQVQCVSRRHDADEDERARRTHQRTDSQPVFVDADLRLSIAPCAPPANRVPTESLRTQPRRIPNLGNIRHLMNVTTSAMLRPLGPRICWSSVATGFPRLRSLKAKEHRETTNTSPA